MKREIGKGNEFMKDIFRLQKNTDAKNHKSVVKKFTNSIYKVYDCYHYLFIETWNRKQMSRLICNFNSCYLILKMKSINQLHSETKFDKFNLFFNHRLITIQIDHQISSFQDLGVFRSHNPETEAQMSYALAALNYKIEREHAARNSFGLLFI